MNGGGGKSAGGGGSGGRHGSVSGANDRKKKGKPKHNRSFSTYQSSGTRVGGGRPKRRGKPISPAKSRNVG